jgi:hypothetical protein
MQHFHLGFDTHRRSVEAKTCDKAIKAAESKGAVPFEIEGSGQPQARAPEFYERRRVGPDVRFRREDARAMLRRSGGKVSAVEHYNTTKSGSTAGDGRGQAQNPAADDGNVRMTIEVGRDAGSKVLQQLRFKL